jgi:hypothetical protein
MADLKISQMTLKPEERTRCEVWTRAMGYFRPISFFNAGKQQEHRDRRYFREAPTSRSRVPAAP